MVRYFFLFCTMCFLLACKTGPVLFGKKNLHEQYAHKIEQAGLGETVLGKLWFNEASKALNQPGRISIPYKEIGYFPAENPRAAGLLFNAVRGQKLFFEVALNPSNDFLLFADLWRSGDKPTLLLSIDTAQTKFEYEVDEDGDYVLRLQPELLKSCDYTLSISIGPSLAHPVAEGKGRISSVWGDIRDAGARRHEGIDIFAPLRTPVVAAADGVVTRVNENNLGGKVVWLRPKGKNLSLYYAHLDEQLVRNGQTVKAGDTLGLIGNTGNARTTPPHLHFGIYSSGGAINPLPFVDPVVKAPKLVPKPTTDFHSFVRLNKNESIAFANEIVRLNRNTVLEPVAVSSNAYRVVLFNGINAVIPKTSIEDIAVVKSAQVNKETHIYDAPSVLAARLSLLGAGTPVKVFGHYNEFALVGVNHYRGWIYDSTISR